MSDKKQEVVNKNFSFNNISNADELINKNNLEDDTKIVYLFRIDKDYYHRFNFLKNERAIRTKNYTEYNSDVFIIMIKIVEEYLKEKDIYKTCTELFKQNVNKRGKRRKNSRTVAKDRLEELQIYLSKEQSDIYLDCFYSHVVNNKEEDVNDTSFSKNYFFNDVMNYVSDNKNKFYKYLPI
ncbi:hypothetical protein [Tenacibaculum maritimum]|uniref:hypothetical protein n=1 Tax=Tenacibaculum maritimum TaxID=107401 RepID=UPI003875EEA1